MKLDVCWGYNNVHIRESNENKATFKTQYGLYKPTAMYFGLTNLLATFQMIMNHIYHDVIFKHEPLGMTIHIYMDDISIATCTNMAGHVAVVSDVLCIVKDNP